MNVTEAHSAEAWDSFLGAQQYRPFLQSWTMGEVYRTIGQEPVRLQVEDNGKIVAICFAHIVPAKRGRHLSVPYGPVLEIRDQRSESRDILDSLMTELKRIAKEHHCSFIRLSPFWKSDETLHSALSSLNSPLHLLAEHIWYLPLVEPDPWLTERGTRNERTRNADEIFKEFRATHRNLIRRAEKEGVTIQPSSHPTQDIEHFIKLHEETRRRHGFTAYTNAFFRAQVAHFAPRGELTLYMAKYQGEVIAASIHMHAFGETSYHHGASSSVHNKIPASYLLQWTAIQDALKRGDHVFNFWGIAPFEVQSAKEKVQSNSQFSILNSQFRKHPFAGVTMFKTGFSGNVLNLMHCQDIPVNSKYWLTRGFEFVRKWRRGF